MIAESMDDKLLFLVVCWGVIAGSIDYKLLFLVLCGGGGDC